MFTQFMVPAHEFWCDQVYDDVAGIVQSFSCIQSARGASQPRQGANGGLLAGLGIVAKAYGLFARGLARDFERAIEHVLPGLRTAKCKR